MAERMIFLGFGKWARADRISHLAPLEGDAQERVAEVLSSAL